MVLFLLPLDVLDDRAVARPRGILVGLCRVADRPEGLANYTELVTHAARDLAVDRRDARTVQWLIGHGVDINAKRTLYDCNHTALHMCAERGLTEIAAQLLAAGADTTILDDKFHADALGWTEYCKQPKVAKLIHAHRAALGGAG